MEKRQKDMKERIQETALRLFTKQGYDKTSLREISEQLGITKAALYYHYRSKEDMLRSIVEEMFASLEELLGWAEEEPPTDERRREFLRRFADLAFDRLKHYMRFALANSSLLRSMNLGKGRIRPPAIMDRLRAILCPPGADTEEQVRSMLALAVLFVGASPLGDMDRIKARPEQIKTIVVTAAIEMLPSKAPSVMGKK